MTYEQSIIGVIVIVFVILLALCVHCVDKAYTMSKYATALLLDEFTYRDQRTRLLRLIETSKAKDQTSLFRSVLFDLEDSAERIKRQKSLTPRIWQLHRRFTETGESLTTILDRRAAEEMGAPAFEKLRKQNLASVEAALKIQIPLIRLRNRIRRFLDL